MLADEPIYATLAASDLDRARRWYEERLGLTPSRESPDGLFYRCGNGTMFFLFQTSAAGSATNTVASFIVADVRKTVDELRSRGVVFEEYDLPGLKTEDGIAELKDEVSAWFKDSEGNILAIGELRVTVP